MENKTRILRTTNGNDWDILVWSLAGDRTMFGWEDIDNDKLISEAIDAPNAPTHFVWMNEDMGHKVAEYLALFSEFDYYLPTENVLKDVANEKSTEWLNANTYHRSNRTKPVPEEEDMEERLDRKIDQLQKDVKTLKHFNEVIVKAMEKLKKE